MSVVEKPQRPKAGTAQFTALVLAIATWFVAPWEGERRSVYRDIVGVPTVCFGHTGNDVQMGLPARTEAECRRLLTGDLKEAYAHVQRCIVAPLWPEQAAAFTSLAFNVGPQGVCGSTLAKHANAGNMAQACGQLMRWVYAGGKRVQGLVNRRQAEYKLCMKPLIEGRGRP